MKGRRSIRRFHETKVDPRILERILEAALQAPSAHNRQPWRWVIVQAEEDKRALAEDMGADLARTRTADGDDPLEIQKDVERSIERITLAPVAIIACMDMAEMDPYPDPTRSEAERIMAVQSVAMAAQNIMLLALAEGLGSCWLCAPLFSPSSVHEVLDIPEAWIPQGMILLGYPDDPGRARARKSLKEVVRWL